MTVWVEGTSIVGVLVRGPHGGALIDTGETGMRQVMPGLMQVVEGSDREHLERAVIAALLEEREW